MNHYCFSLGENCLTDNILRRHHLKSFSTIYSHGRSNADYIIALEEIGYNLDIILKGLTNNNDDNVCRSNEITQNDKIFHPIHSLGLELTHHDPINNENHRQEIHRRCKRMGYLKKELTIINAFYFHRANANSNIPLLIGKLKRIRDYYVRDGCWFFLNLFYQKSHSKQRSHEIVNHNDYFSEYIFNTYKTWTGSDPNLMWALVDDDLIKSMLDDTQSRILSLSESHR